ncbi:methyltransferase domain-containing protein [Stenotrophomonas bentonitica]|uniref:methyltransferase domain-containing protein n=1 Tax=Stenotrophomonas bentonitica TaxID=1450134 RepID=UPI00345E521F
MNTQNREYWLSRDGSLYADQQKVRREAGNESYGLQERWLTDILRSLSSERGAPLRVLDYGVGFGRMTRVLAELDFVDYHGYDISEAMVDPLLRSPPARYQSDIRERVVVGPKLSTVVDSAKFDVIFTVSVMIHNSPEQAREVLSEMRSTLAPGGIICLIENRPVSISMLSNLWHAGCWSHDFAHTTADDMDVDVDDGLFADHGVYFLRERPIDSSRTLRVPGGAGFEIVTKAEYLLRCHENTVAVVRGLESEINVSGSQLAEQRDAVELYRRAEQHALAAFESISDELLPLLPSLEGQSGHLTDVLDLVPKLSRALGEQATDNARKFADLKTESAQFLELQRTESLAHADALRAELAAALAEQKSESELQLAQLQSNHEAIAKRFHWQLGLRERIGRLISQDDVLSPAGERPQGPIEPQLPSVPAPIYQIDAPRDTRFAQPMAGHDSVCHVLHQEWFGIRAAAGALPGHKLAVSASDRPSVHDIEAVARQFESLGIARIVVHGFSNAMAAWIKGLSAVGFGHIYLVWHGAPVMWVHHDERRFFSLALQLAKQGYIRRIQGMRGGTHAAIGDIGWSSQIYNMPPNFNSKTPRHARRHTQAIAFSPSWNLVHKNLSTNVAAAVACPAVDNVWVMASDFQLPYATDKSIEVIPKLDQAQMMETMSLCDIVLNASIVDCHPMVELEALAVGTPSVRGRLGLDALENHDYVRLTEVRDALNVADVSAAIGRILSVPDVEIEGMMNSYSAQLIELSNARYAEFMEL